MTTEQFTYWLQGYFELSGATTLNEQQVKVIKEHIALVLKKETPNYLTIQGPPATDNKIYIRTTPVNNYNVPNVVTDTYCTNNQLISKDTLVDVPTNLTC